MKLKLFGIALTLFMMLAPSVMASAGEYDVVVTGTDTSPDDVNKVQDAVDQYDKILLRGTFDFGDWGAVAVTRDGVEIHGEKDGDQYRTTIKGGQAPFLVGSTATGPLEWVLNPDAIVPVTDFSVEDISFEDPIIAVAVLACHGELKISGNKVVDGRPFDWFGYPHGMAFFIGSIGANFDPTVITADITITDNYIDGMGRSWDTQQDPWAVYHPEFERWYRGIKEGIYILDVDARAHIAGNELRNILSSTIFLVNSVHSETMAASVTRNILVPSPTEMEGSPLDVLTMSVHVAHNQVEIANPNTSGLGCWGCYDSVFEQNRIHSEAECPTSIALLADPEYGAVSNVLVRANRITGRGQYALVVAPVEGGLPLASYNTFVGNNVSRFTPSEAHYLFEEGANHNVVAGRHGEVIDRGQGNRITGLTKKPGNIGQQISNAMQKRRERLKQMRW